MSAGNDIDKPCDETHREEEEVLLAQLQAAHASGISERTIPDIMKDVEDRLFGKQD